jgi:hypothetical protein
LAAIVVKLDPDMIVPGLMIALIAGALPTDQPTPPVGEPPVARRSPGRPVSTADLNQQLLALHNRPRDEVGVPPLSWSPALADQAQVWAETLIAGRRFEHDGARGLVGENLWAGWGRRFSPEEMVEAWTEERSAYVHGVYPHVRRPGDATVGRSLHPDDLAQYHRGRLCRGRTGRPPGPGLSLQPTGECTRRDGVLGGSSD